ncbi:reverse transcriptase domain-containing protein [Tanacetum coccineum]
MLSPQGAVRLWKNLRLLLFLHLLFHFPKKNQNKTAHVPPPGEEDSIFIEIPKPKAKKIVNVEVQDLNSPRPNSYPYKLPYPERMKVRENDKPSAQHSLFLKLFKQLRLEIGLKDDLVEMPKFNKWLSSLLRNKEKLEEIAITTVNAECSAIIMNKVPEKLEDPGKFLTPCALQELNRTSALADSGASINLLPYSIYKKLELEALTPTQKQGKEFVHAISVIDFSKDDPFSGSTTTHSDDPSPSSSPVKTSDNFVKFADELAPLNSLPPGNDDSTLKKINLISPGLKMLIPKISLNESPKLDRPDDPSIPRPLPEPSDIEKCFEPKAGILIIKEFKGVSKSHDFMTSILPTLVSDLPFISSIVSFENEDTIFDPGIVTFLRAGGIF